MSTELQSLMTGIKSSVHKELDNLKVQRQMKATEEFIHSEWGSRTRQYDAGWDEARPKVLKKFIEFQAFKTGKCQSCMMEDSFIRCLTCRRHLCHKCDTVAHTQMVFHDRKFFMSSGNICHLAQNEFLSELKEIEKRGN